MAEVFDLFGDPVPANRGKRGRPEHVPTQENRNKVNMLLAYGWSNDRIASSLNITAKTLRKHYLPELRFRDAARDRLDAKVAMTLWEQFQAGSSAAGREFLRHLERNDLAFGRGMVNAPAAEASDPEAGKKLGKKEALNRDAQTGHEGTGWAALLQ